MGVYIPNMEMPREKKTTLTIFPDGRVYENHGERLWGYGEDCIPWKAVPVPAHGDLIDRDAYEYPGDLIDEPVIIPASEEGE